MSNLSTNALFRAAFQSLTLVLTYPSLLRRYKCRGSLTGACKWRCRPFAARGSTDDRVGGRQVTLPTCPLPTLHRQQCTAKRKASPLRACLRGLLHFYRLRKRIVAKTKGNICQAARESAFVDKFEICGVSCRANLRTGLTESILTVPRQKHSQ